MRQRFGGWAQAAALLLILVACGGKLTQQSFEKVTPGMNAEQVKELLGEPTTTNAATVPLLGTVTTYVYKTEKSEVTVIFHNDKLATKTGSVSE